MPYDYERSAKTAANPPLHKPAEADEALAKAYLALHAFKAAFDDMHEIPKSLEAVYKQTMKAAEAVGKARESTYQLREMARRLPR